MANSNAERIAKEKDYELKHPAYVKVVEQIINQPRRLICDPRIHCPIVKDLLDGVGDEVENQVSEEARDLVQQELRRKIVDIVWPVRYGLQQYLIRESRESGREV